MDGSMILVDDTGREVECNVIARFNIQNNSYIAYTDGTMSGDELNLLVSKYNVVNNEIKLEEITSDEEWAQVNDYLDKNLYEVGD